ncbi:MAG: hypothetical protein ACI9LE_000551 [Paraglaciecola sp.]|jgi:hypothetical protein
MSNKTLFWVAYFTLSSCDCGLFVYLSNTLAHVKACKFAGITLHDDANHDLDKCLEFNDNSIRYLLPI